MPQPDVIIVGARIAGSLTATLLGERGWRVLLLDRATFPSDTLSTHFFRWPAMEAFRRAGVFDEVHATGAPPLRNSFNDVDGHVFSEPVQGEGALDYYLCVRRITLDDILVHRARRERTVEVREGVTVRGLLRDGPRVIGVRISRGSAEEEITAPVVVGADGIRSLVARAVDPRAERSEPVHRAMYYAYFAELMPQDPPAAEFHYRGDELVYVFPCDGDRALLAVSVPIAEFPRWKQDGERLFMERLHGRPQLTERLRRAAMVSKVFGAGDIPGYIRVPYGDGWVLAGDSGIIMDPFSGQGIDQASTHAVYLADALHRWLSGEGAWDAAMAGYHRARNAFTEKTYLRTSSGARDLRQITRPALQRRGLSS
jgi:2-polyprenyl-6-methoxyphenol hydroxylase-like FAD-dependent oxidoreductase